MIEIDGSMMEGGGQLLRMATTYSAVLTEPIRVYNIRAGRSTPGLRPQHLKTLEAASEISGAKTHGAEIKSKEIEFYPQEINGGEYSYNIGTAGSITLLLQCLIPIAAYSDKTVKITVTGGTAVKWSPPTPFLTNVVWRAFRKMGIECRLEVNRHGFYPIGGGEVIVKVEDSSRIMDFNPHHQGIETIYGVSVCGKLPSHVAERQAKSARKELIQEGFEADIDILTLTGSSEPYSPGSLITLWTDSMYLGSDSLGERGKPAETVGKEAANSLLSQIKTGAEVDLHTCDHLILPCSLASGTSSFKTSKLTMHTITAIELAKIFTKAKFQVTGERDEPAEITCEGIGLNRQR
ncbi:RNA 3'-terminal phosphate cyclase [Candidatus Bathyarchaeota archaeon]|nr:RNA 3'-terminal phosphate cyclase [Candidatus Bathyarchaeota archaeon]